MSHAQGRKENGTRPADKRLFGLGLHSIWQALCREPLVFWLLCFYVGVEYLRPQTVYPVLNVVPWGRVSIGACLLALILFGGGYRRKLRAMDGLFLAFFGWVLLSAMLALRPEDAFQAWGGPVSWIALYLFLTFVVVTPRRLLLFFLAFFLINLKMSQHGTRVWMGRGFSFSSWGATGSPGWFQNSGEFAMEMTLFLGLSWCVFLAFRPHLGKWKWRLLVGLFPATAAMSILASSSRGGQIAAVFVVLSLMLASRIRLRNIVLVGVVLLAGWYFVPGEQRVRFETMGDDETSKARLTYWAQSWELAQENPLAGIGYENWVPYYQRKYGVSGVEVHNTVLEAAVELGYPGAFLFFAMVALSFRMNARTRRRAGRLGDWGGVFSGMATGLDVGMIGLFISSLFMSVLFYPMFWMSFGLTTALAEGTRRAALAEGAGRAAWDARAGGARPTRARNSFSPDYPLPRG